MFVLSSSSEGFSIATIEAMAAGLPVIATRCGGPEEILEHQKTGYLIPTENPGELASAIKLAWRQSACVKACKCRQRTYAQYIFAKKMLLSYQQHYTKLLNKTGLA
ncbi:MAG: glycosyltransferase family 4 protein [Cellvibrio sp.]|nr:glycosyltransferase family 4 protein [Cellvibrio sp.]